MAKKTTNKLFCISILYIIYSELYFVTLMLNKLDRIWVRSTIIDCEITLYHKKNQRNLIWHFCNIVKLCIHENLALQF